MMLLFQLIAITTIWVLGLTVLTQPGMLLYGVRKWTYDKGHWPEPVISCVWCMPSLHSAIGYLFAFAMNLFSEFTWPVVVMYPLVAMGASMSAGFIWTAYIMVEKQRKFYDNDDQTQEEYIKEYP